MNPWHQFLSYERNKGLMAGQFAVAYLLVKAVGQNSYKRGDLPLAQEIVQNSRSGNSIKVCQAIKHEEEPIRFAARCVTRRRIDPNAAFIVENMTAQAMHLDLPLRYARGGAIQGCGGAAGSSRTDTTTSRSSEISSSLLYTNWCRLSGSGTICVPKSTTP